MCVYNVVAYDCECTYLSFLRYFVLARTDPDIEKGFKGLTGFIVDADTPGIITGRKVLSKKKKQSLHAGASKDTPGCSCIIQMHTRGS